MAVWWLATSKNEGHCSYNELKYRKVLAQGWPALGDLSAFLPISNLEKFNNLIATLVDYVYEYDDKRGPGRILSNLINFDEGDLVVCTEGRSVKGIAKVGKDPEYRFDDGGGLYEYAQTIYPVTEWRDWDVKIAGTPPDTGTMGPIGITHMNKDSQRVIDAWEKLSS